MSSSLSEVIREKRIRENAAELLRLSEGDDRVEASLTDVATQASQRLAEAVRNIVRESAKTTKGA